MFVDEVKVEAVGITPLILHNGRTANPLDIYAKKMKSITSKRNRTDEDHEALAMIQWESTLYWDDELGLYMPSENMYASFYHAAKKFKLGTKCSGVTFPAALGYPIITKNHKNLALLKADPANKFLRPVVVQRAKTMACRAIFDQWSINFNLEFETDVFNINEVKNILSYMQQRVGFGVWRPGSPKPGWYGKFMIKTLKWINGKTHEEKTLNLLKE